MPTHSQYLDNISALPGPETYSPRHAESALDNISALPGPETYSPRHAESALAAPIAPRPQAGLNFGAPPQQAAPSPAVYYNHGQKKMSVNGVVFDVDDHDKAVRSQDALNRPAAPPPEGVGWNLLPDAEYQKYIDKIVDPSLGRLASKNVGIGVDVSQMLAGSALKFVGAEETGQAIIDQQAEDLRFNAPYQRQFTDIDSAGGAGEWFVANAAQMAPLMAELFITAVATGGVGAVAGATSVGARLLATGGAKYALKVGSKRTAEQAMLALRNIRANKAVSASGRAALKRVGAISGARIGAMAASYGVAVGDIYQSIEESGNYDSPTLARFMTFLFAVPYALAELAPASLAIATGIRAVTKKGLKSGTRLRRLVMGAAVGGGLEGSTEAFQELITLGVAGELDLSDPEVRNQFINAFFAGAGVGVPIGGIANVLGKSIEVPKIDDIGKDDLNLVEIEPTPGLTPQLPPLEGQPIEEPGPGPVEPTPGLTPQLPPLEGQEIEELVSEPVLDEQAAEPEEGMFPPDAPVDPALLAPDNPPPAVGEAFKAVYAEQDAAQDEQFLPAEQQAAEQRAAEQLRNEQELAAVQPLSTQMDLPLPPVDIPFPDNMTPATEPPSPAFTGEPTINMPHRVNETGEVVMRPVTVREAIETSNQRVNALEELAMCLGGK